MSIFSKIGHFLAKLFSSVKNDADKIAIAITEGVQTALKSGVVSALADVIEGIFPGVQHIPTAIVAQLQDLTPKILAAELGLQGLPDNATPEQLADFEAQVLAAFGAKPDKSKLWTTLSASIYGILQNYVALPAPTFAEAVAAVEAAYQAYKNALADQETADAD